MVEKNFHQFASNSVGTTVCQWYCEKVLGEHINSAKNVFENWSVLMN